MLLFQFFEPTYFNLENTICFIFQSPYKKAYVLNVVQDWYLQNSANSAQTIQLFADEKYKTEKSNNWFFNIIDKIPKNQRNIILEKYFNNIINTSAKIDINEDFTFTDMLFKDYMKSNKTGLRIGDFFTDLKRVSAHINTTPNSTYILKIKTEKRRKPQLSILNESQFYHKLNSWKLGSVKKNKTSIKVSAWTIYTEGRNSYYLTYADMSFYTNQPNVFSIFQGYEYDPVQNVEIQIITPFLDHIKNIICSHNETIYEYIINWLSFLFQFPSSKTEIAIVLTGLQGTGKNVFTDTICNLLGEYANDNACIDNITGEFNDSIINKRLIVCNEVSTFTTNKKFNADKLKTLITESTIDINKKFMSVSHQQNVCNFIILSNNFAPIKIEEGDRRYLVSEVSAEQIINEAYFGPLNATFTPEFYSHLLTFFLSRDISNWQRKRIPMTTRKEEIISASKSKYYLFIQEKITKFASGYIRSESFKDFKKWCSENGYTAGNNQDYKLEILTYCSEWRPGPQFEKRPYFYKLKAEYYKLFNIEVPEQKDSQNDSQNDVEIIEFQLKK